jgi:hypothetical protein
MSFVSVELPLPSPHDPILFSSLKGQKHIVLTKPRNREIAMKILDYNPYFAGFPLVGAHENPVTIGQIRATQDFIEFYVPPPPPPLKRQT